MILVLSKEERKGGGLISDLDLDPDPWKILWIRIRQNDADPLDPDRNTGTECTLQHQNNPC